MSLEEVKSNVEHLAQRVGASGFVLPTYGHSEGFARPHIEVDDRGYHYVVVERGKELSRFTTTVIDELLYRVFENVTFTLAFDYELKHRVEGQDCRRVGFQHQIELLSALSREWARRSEQEHNQILQEHPFNDCVDARVALTKQLREQGHSPEDAWQIARKKYPGPSK